MCFTPFPQIPGPDPNLLHLRLLTCITLIEPVFPRDAASPLLSVEVAYFFIVQGPLATPALHRPCHPGARPLLLSILHPLSPHSAHPPDAAIYLPALHCSGWFPAVNLSSSHCLSLCT